MKIEILIVLFLVFVAGVPPTRTVACRGPKDGIAARQSHPGLQTGLSARITGRGAPWKDFIAACSLLDYVLSWRRLGWVENPFDVIQSISRRRIALHSNQF